MSQPANPDPTGVFSSTEYDLATAKGLNAPPSDYHPETGLGLLGFGMCRVDLNAPQPEPIPDEPGCAVGGCEFPGHFRLCGIWICKRHHLMIEVRFREGVL